MNDIVSLDSVRRGRGRERGRVVPAESGAEVESEVVVSHDAVDEWYSAEPETHSAQPEARKTARSSNHPAGRARAVDVPPVAVQPIAVLPVAPQLSDEERLDRVSDTVIRALGRRQLSADETHALLMAQGASDEEAVVLVARYEELGYLNDLALAESLVERLSERSHKSRAVISRELIARKIPMAFVEAALEQLDESEEFERALEAGIKRAGQLSSYDDVTAERRLMGFLTRRGYTSGVVREATKRALAERNKRSSGPRFR